MRTNPTLSHRHQTDRCLSTTGARYQQTNSLPSRLYIDIHSSLSLIPLPSSNQFFHYHRSTIPAPNPQIGRSQLYVKKNSHAASITNKLSNSSAAERRALHQISPPYSSSAFASPPFPTLPRISSPIGCHSEGSLMAKNRRRTQEEAS
jgi:hypothetical protein